MIKIAIIDDHDLFREGINLVKRHFIKHGKSTIRDMA